jgi:hypothetical protein
MLDANSQPDTSAVLQMEERSLFRADINSDCKYLEVPPGAVSY